VSVPVPQKCYIEDINQSKTFRAAHKSYVYFCDCLIPERVIEEYKVYKGPVFEIVPECNKVCSNCRAANFLEEFVLKAPSLCLLKGKLVELQRDLRFRCLRHWTLESQRFLVFSRTRRWSLTWISCIRSVRIWILTGLEIMLSDNRETDCEESQVVAIGKD